MAETAAELLGECLAAAGVRRVFGAPVPGLDHVPVADPDLARLLADADGRTATLGAALLPGQRLHLGAAPGVDADPVRIDDPADLPVTVARACRLDVPGAAELNLTFGFDWQVRPGVEAVRPASPPGDLGKVLAAARAVGDGVLVLAGPGVARTDHVDDLQHLAEITGWGVVNSFGAKGLFPWDDPHHLGTAGLQERDWELAGFPEAPLVLLTGPDPRESPRARWDHGDDVELHPRFLAALADRWDGPTGEPVRPRLYTELAAVVGPLYEDDTWPRNPARAALDLADTRPEGGLLAADPGPAGLWVARACPTVERRSVVVPATQVEGFAAAAALVAGLDGRPAVAVTTAPADETSLALLELAASLEVPLSLQVWGDDEGRREQVGDRVRRQGLPVDFAATRDLVEVAGPVIAWQGEGG